MAQDTLTLYKLIISRMLGLVAFPLTNAQISAYLLDRGYADYFDIQQSLSEMVSEELITVQSTYSTSSYELTRLGEESLRYFGNQIPDVIEKDLETYMREHRYDLRETVSVQTDYTMDPAGGYLATFRLLERGKKAAEIQIHTDTEEEAARAADRFKKRHGEIYEYLYQVLLLPDAEHK